MTDLREIKNNRVPTWTGLGLRCKQFQLWNYCINLMKEIFISGLEIQRWSMTEVWLIPFCIMQSKYHIEWWIFSGYIFPSVKSKNQFLILEIKFLFSRDSYVWLFIFDTVRLPTSLFISKEASTAEWRREKEERERGLHACGVQTAARPPPLTPPCKCDKGEPVCVYFRPRPTHSPQQDCSRFWQPRPKSRMASI